jgi:predicted transposase/invertase (TIGR01784 family)
VIQQASIEDGIEIGIEIGEKNAQERIARQLKNTGIDMNIIAQSTGLSLEDVQKL